MNEIRKNHILQLMTKSGEKLDGIVFDYAKDRILVLIAYESLYEARKLNDLDELLVTAYTHLGVKKMFCHVIDGLKSNNCIVIENNESIPVEQKREFVRVLSNITFKIEKQDNNIIDCFCINISGGGIAFSVTGAEFKIGEIVQINLSEDDFGKEIKTSGEIIKEYNNFYVAKFLNLQPHDEDKIVKYVFNLIAKK